jgi:tRNA G18 (ribose-2'-O)-methylase SpoU
MEINTPGVIGPGEFFPVVGVGPHPEPWPTDSHFDQELLAHGDRRNVLDKYRYWTVEAIVADLNTKRHSLQIAIENWQHDLNIGSVVRTANAFNVSAVHIVGKRDWNKRGAMVTDRYLTVIHHPTVNDFSEWSHAHGIPIIGIDNLPGSRHLEGSTLPQECILFFGQEGAGMSEEAIAACSALYEIEQYGSTRSMNASASAAISLYHGALKHLPRKQ